MQTHEEDISAQISSVRVDDVGYYYADDAIPEPVTSSGKSNALCTNWKLEDLANYHPRGWTPCRSKEEDVKAHKNDENVVASLRVGVHGPYRRNSELADRHAYGAVYEKRPPAIPLDSIEAHWRGANIDHCCDHRDEERVLHADGLEKGCVVAGLVSHIAVAMSGFRSFLTRI